jgi:DNA-directed RNA polymerase subunit RPC12/RpoP
MMHTCLRCGYEWPQRYDHTPRACPACKTYKFNVPRAMPKAPVIDDLPGPPADTKITERATDQPKLLCQECGGSFLAELIENGLCIWCRPGMLSKCVKCGRTTGKNLQDKETGLCPTCKDVDK